MNPILLILLVVLIRGNESAEYCDYQPDEEIPDEFNPWRAWPRCTAIIGDIKDQSKCGACWSVAIASALSDRICIASNGTQQVKISSWDIQSCYPNLRNQCSSGYSIEIEDVFKLWVSHGFTSGGNYGEFNTCRPYPFKPYDQCDDCVDKTRTYRCNRRCVNGANYQRDKHFGRSYCKVRNDERAIRSEIMKHGSVIAVFIVFDDFPRRANNYDFRQIYESNLRDFKAKHVVKIVGWGVQHDIHGVRKPYWILQNSWGPSYGLSGYFKMIRGTNNCDIEGNVWAGYV